MEQTEQAPVTPVQPQPEDPRKTGLKNGLRQLSLGQLQRVLSYRGTMVLDTYNYENGNYCPLAVACGLPGVVKNPTHERVRAILELMGYKVNNTKGIEGTFYTTNRLADLIEATKEVVAEKQQEIADAKVKEKASANQAQA
jgi:hypothetical protein